MALIPSSSALGQLIYANLEPLVSFGGGDPKFHQWCDALAKSICEWISQYGTDAVTLVAGSVTTSGGPTNQAGPIIQFTGKIV